MLPYVVTTISPNKIILGQSLSTAGRLAFISRCRRVPSTARSSEPSGIDFSHTAKFIAVTGFLPAFDLFLISHVSTYVCAQHAELDGIIGLFYAS